ncbi:MULTISPECIES: TetR family transcriptional regulator [unclassified Rhizobium]|uniref:TetR family transcriptional regulator n=1 Tax=unclassified Rhizobium TaxID=2613769 RepID=UPI000CDF3306|nr:MULTISPECIES: TetR family transcriptional regulator [Rhizobium]AVA20193.1 TetR family transcriptional regulator protein [Rhizobium sp. NXC24]MDK4740687.1 TetR family transcriptional regulator [Rhizobium sp. CNPSo 3464]UWU21491.1 TetR/AcrR family transcriptional regulator [Rhizobium tropici]
MADANGIDGEVKEGRRERKRRQTRERIEAAALSLFLQRGFDGTTIEDITEAADVSKRSFFDYFPSKEEVVFAWQDSFSDELADAIAAQPKNASIVEVIEGALTSAVLAASSDQQNFAIAALIRETPALCARDQLKYAKLEQKLTDALCARFGGGDEEQFRLRLLSAIVVSTLRVGGERWNERPQELSLQDYAHRVFEELWTALAEFGTLLRQRNPDR